MSVNLNDNESVSYKERHNSLWYQSSSSTFHVDRKNNHDLKIIFKDTGAKMRKKLEKNV